MCCGITLNPHVGALVPGVLQSSRVMQTAALHEWLQQELQRAQPAGRALQPGALILQLVRRAVLEGC